VESRSKTRDPVLLTTTCNRLRLCTTSSRRKGMDVGQIAKEWYQANEPEGALARTLLRCFFGGTIIRRPDFLLMGEVCWTDGKEISMDRQPHNCWWIWFWTTEKGTMSSYDLCLEAPFQLPWVAFKRRGKNHIISWEKLYWKDFKYGRSTKCTSTTTTECRR
jgi:hypothetical protein